MAGFEVDVQTVGQPVHEVGSASDQDNRQDLGFVETGVPKLVHVVFSQCAGFLGNLHCEVQYSAIG